MTLNSMWLKIELEIYEQGKNNVEKTLRMEFFHEK